MENNKNVKHNTYSILGFVFAFVFSLAGLILSIIGLIKAKQDGNKKGLAIAGIVISSLSIIITIGIVLVFCIIMFSNSEVDTSKQNIYNNSLDIIEDYVEMQYDMCKSGLQNFDMELLDSNTCKLNSNYSDYAINNSGIGVDKISYVKIKITKDDVEIIEAADGTGALEGAKYLFYLFD